MARGTSDITVIGGGVVGLATALGLLRAGRRVTVLDGSDSDFRASQGNFGLVWLQGKGAGYAPYARWSYEAAQAWPEFAKRLSGLADVDLAPSLTGLPEHLSEAEFRRRYGSSDSAAYQQVNNEVERRVAALPLYR